MKNTSNMSSLSPVEWKQEPLSPSGSLSGNEVTVVPEDTLYLSDLEQDDYFKLETDLLDSCSESKAQVASQILENLENLVDLDELIKEEPYFLDLKVLPALEEVDPLIKLAPISQSFLNEFEFSVAPQLEYNTPHPLTPPQSPPQTGSDAPMLTILEPLGCQQYYPVISIKQEQQQQQVSQFNVPEKQLFDFRSEEYSPNLLTPQHDIAHELELVDELIRSRIENMRSDCPSSPCSNSNSSSTSSNFGDCSSSEDPEWIPDTVETYCSEEANSASNSIKTSRKRSKPYSRTTEDKKFRKKEQNKNAATRYRLKKKAEVDVILSEEKDLMDEGQNLGTQITDLEREIKYLKGLMRDLFTAKGLI